MANSIKWRNISVLLKFFCNDSVQGLFTRPFLREKRNRYLLGTGLLVAYLLYFYLNMREISLLSLEGVEVPQEVMLFNARMLISSYINFTLIFGMLLFVFVNSTISLNRASLYFAKILPFSPREINWSQRIFNVSAALFFFELILIIIVPGLRLIAMPIFAILLFIVMLHVVFIAVFFFISLLYQVAMRVTPLSRRVLVSSCLDMAFFVVAAVYFYQTRISVDKYVAHQSWSIMPTIIVVLVAALALLSFSVYGASKFTDDLTYHRTKFVYLGRLKSYGISASIPPTVRNKEFLYFSALIVIVSGMALTQVSYQDALQSLVFVIPLIGISAVSYADGTVDARKMYPLLRISPLYETGTIVFSAAVMMLPALVLGWFATYSIDPYLFGICIFLSAVIAGLLFPKSRSNLNETISVTLTIVVIALLTAIVNINGALYPAVAILSVILFSILKKESTG